MFTRPANPYESSPLRSLSPSMPALIAGLPPLGPGVSSNNRREGIYYVVTFFFSLSTDLRSTVSGIRFRGGALICGPMFIARAKPRLPLVYWCPKRRDVFARIACRNRCRKRNEFDDRSVVSTPPSTRRPLLLLQL